MSAPAPQPLRRRERPRRRRRRGARRRARALPGLVPHLFTTGNLAAGFYAITLATGGEIERAALAILVAGIFDVLDGRLARMARTTSRFGGEYDSIADTVSFGVAPAMLAYSAGALQQLGWTGWVLAFVYTACAALRLARFNVKRARYRGRFEGLPTPAAAGLVLSAVWFAGFLRTAGLPLDPPPALVGAGVAALGLVMVSPVPYRSFKDVRLRGGERTVVLMVVAFAVILMKPALTLFPLGIAYLLSGPLEWAWRRRTGHALEALEEDESGEGRPAGGEPTRGPTP